MKALSRIYVGLIIFFLYAPVLVMIAFSFNSSSSVWVFTGFSTEWYLSLATNSTMLTALKHTIIVAILSAVISTVLGTAAAVGIMALRKKITQKIIMSITDIPMMNADIVTGISLMLLFIFFGRLIGLTESLGFFTVLIAHITFNLPYVILSVMPKLKQTDSNLQEAALDLGCTPTMTFFRVELPLVVPGVVSGLMLGFTLSLDDFVISHFVSSPDFQTLPLYVYNQTAHEVKYSMYALCALMVFVILILLLAVNFAGAKNEKKVEHPRKVRRKTGGAA